MEKPNHEVGPVIMWGVSGRNQELNSTIWCLDRREEETKEGAAGPDYMG